jgi:hypothetical protein
VQELSGAREGLDLAESALRQQVAKTADAEFALRQAQLDVSAVRWFQTTQSLVISKVRFMIHS